MNYLENLKEYRKKAKLSQYDVAEHLKIPQTQVLRYEKGINEIPLRYFIELCKLYKTTPNDILGF